MNILNWFRIFGTFPFLGYHSLERLCQYKNLKVNSLDFPVKTHHIACHWFVYAILTSFCSDFPKLTKLSIMTCSADLEHNVFEFACQYSFPPCKQMSFPFSNFLYACFKIASKPFSIKIFKIVKRTPRVSPKIFVYPGQCEYKNQIIVLSPILTVCIFHIF